MMPELLHSCLQTLVNIGGAAGYMAGYNATYWGLFGQPLELAPDGSSLVTHMLVCEEQLE